MYVLVALIFTGVILWALNKYCPEIPLEFAGVIAIVAGALLAAWVDYYIALY